MKTRLILMISIILPSVLFGQKLNYEIEINIDSDNKIEHLLFYDSFDGEYEKTEFTKFCVVSGQDTFCIENLDVWVEQQNLYTKADKSIDNRFGIINDNGKTFIWLTGFQYGCCLNNTTILEWTGKSLNTIFNDDFEVIDIKPINDKKYLIGNFSMAEVYGDMESDYYFRSFYPTEYRLFSDSLRVDQKMTQQNNNRMETIEDSIDVYSATIVHINYSGQQIMISNKLENSLNDREYGIISLTKLDRDYFKKLTKQELRIARNEIFAINGYTFNSKDLQDYFGFKKWYKPSAIKSETIANNLTDIEKYNINLIKEIEKNGL